MCQTIKSYVFKIISLDKENYLPSKIFDLAIITLIIINVFLVILDTVEQIPENTKNLFYAIETFSVMVFTIEYLARMWTATLIYPHLNSFKARLKFILTPMAIIDLIAILPFYLPLLIPLDLKVLRLVRLMRLIRIFKLNRYTSALSTVGIVLKSKMTQILSSFFVVFIIMIIASVLMYYFEHEAQPEVFTNAFSAMWWAVATFTTVGYGDIYPVTLIGKILSSIIAILGIGLVAVPTGIISAGFIEQVEKTSAISKEGFSYADEISKYHALMKEGILTEKEFITKKTQLLSIEYSKN